MNDDAGRFLARTGLKSDPEPAASFAGFPVALVATVLAKAKNLFVSPREGPRRSSNWANSSLSIASRRSRLT